MLHRPQPLPAHGPPQAGLHVELLYGQQPLGVLLLLAPAAAGEAAGTAGGDCAEEDPQEGEEDAAAHQAGPDQLQLQGLEAFSQGSQLSLVEIQQDCALIGWILMLLTIALLRYIDTAQGTQSPLLHMSEREIILLYDETLSIIVPVIVH